MLFQQLDQTDTQDRTPRVQSLTQWGREGEGGRERDRERQRQTDRDRQRQTDRERWRRGYGGGGGGYDDNSGLRPARSSEIKIDSRKYSIIGRYSNPPIHIPHSKTAPVDVTYFVAALSPWPRCGWLCSRTSSAGAALLKILYIRVDHEKGEIKKGTQQLPVRSMEETLPRFHSGPLLNLSDGGIVGTTGFQARSTGGRWSWTLKLAQKISWVGRWSWAAKVGLLSLRVVPQQQCNGHCLCDSICPARQLKQQLRSALVAAQWRRDTALTLPLFWRRSTVSPVFFGRYPRSSLHSFDPPLPRPHP